MNVQIAKGAMKELKGDLKQTWAKLTDDDINYLDGNVDEIIGKVQRAYGFTRERAQEEFDSFKRAHANYFREERDINNREKYMDSSLNSSSSINEMRNRSGRVFEEDIVQPSREYMEKVRELGSSAMHRSSELVKNYPGYTILGAASIGFLLGALFSRRN